MNEEKNIGSHSEELVHQICEKMFLPDFVVRNPKCKNKSNNEIEIADTLVFFKSHLIGFQVKAKIEKKGAQEKSDVERKRIYKRIEKGIKQLGSIKAALRDNEIIEVKTSADVKIELKSLDVSKILGVVILDLVGEEKFVEDQQSEILGGFDYFDEIPVHIFMRSDLELISYELDTLPDFLEYLELRERLYSQKILMPYVSERDFLAKYKTDPKILKDAAMGGCDLLMISEGCWGDYTIRNKNLIQKRIKFNQPSYLIDHVISIFNTSIGFNLNKPSLKLRSDVEPGTKQAYMQVITELASTSRLTRRAMALKFQQAMIQAVNEDHGCSVILDKEKKEGFLFFATSKGSREERLEKLAYLMDVAYCGFNLKKLVGISTENAVEQRRAYEFRFVENTTYTNHDELANLAKIHFPTEQVKKYFEFRESVTLPTIKNKKVGRNERCPCGSGLKYKKCCLLNQSKRRMG